MASTIRQRLRRFNGTDYDTIHLETETKAISDYVYPCNPNLLDNWYFVGGGQFPINQRNGYVVPPDTPYYPDTNLSGHSGTVSAYTTVQYVNTTYGTISIDGTTYYVKYAAMVPGYTGYGYGIDRWYHEETLYITNEGITSQGPYLVMLQRIEPSFARMLLNKQITVSALFSNGELSVGTGTHTSLTGGDTVEGSLCSAGFVTSVFYYQNELQLSRISVNPGYTVVAAKTELGDKQTLAHQDANGNWVLNEIPNYQEQLARCQRYYYKSSIIEGELYPSIFYTDHIGEYQAGPEFMLRCVVQFPVEMRVRPTIKVNGGSNNETVSFREQNSGRTLTGTLYYDNFCVNKMKILRFPVRNYTYDGTILENPNMMIFEGYFEADAEI